MLRHTTYNDEEDSNTEAPHQDQRRKEGTSIPPTMEPSRAGGASINGIALLFTIVQRAAMGAAGAATRHPANAVGARSAVAPPKADAKPNILGGAGGTKKSREGLVLGEQNGREGVGRKDNDCRGGGWRQEGCGRTAREQAVALAAEWRAVGPQSSRLRRFRAQLAAALGPMNRHATAEREQRIELFVRGWGCGQDGPPPATAHLGGSPRSCGDAPKGS